jgi:hypothetical protein
VLSCDGSDSETGPWRVEIGGGALRTEIDFGSTRLDLSEETISASLGWHPSGSSFSVEGGIGALVAGTLGGVDLDPGAAFSLTGSWLALTETEVRPFVLGTLTASVLTAPGLTAGDFRAGVVVGKTFFERLTPYLAARVFGGPVYRDGVSGVGNDAHHYAIGAGATLRLPGAFDVFVEGSPLGERSLNAGAGLRF